MWWDATSGTIWLLRGEFVADRKSTRLNSSHLVISYAVFCLKKKTHIVFPPHALSVLVGQRIGRRDVGRPCVLGRRSPDGRVGMFGYQSFSTIVVPHELPLAD